MSRKQQEEQMVAEIAGRADTAYVGELKLGRVGRDAPSAIANMHTLRGPDNYTVAFVSSLAVAQFFQRASADVKALVLLFEERDEQDDSTSKWTTPMLAVMDDDADAPTTALQHLKGLSLDDLREYRDTLQLLFGLTIQTIWDKEIEHGLGERLGTTNDDPAG